jgi:ParB family transcriptional regulator, chromosome partitioning protein
LNLLADSIRARGLLQPLRVRYDSDLDKHFIVVGERRYRACLRAGITKVPVVLIESEPTPAEILAEQLCENLQRVAISPLETAKAFQRYIEIAGCTAKDLANLLNLSPSTISRSLSLLNLDEPTQAKVADGTISATAASEIAKVKNPEVRQRVAAKAVAAGLPAAEVHREVRQKQGPAAPKARVIKNKVFRVERGLKVIISSARAITEEDIIFALEQALAQAQEEDTPDNVNN